VTFAWFYECEYVIWTWTICVYVDDKLTELLAEVNGDVYLCLVPIRGGRKVWMVTCMFIFGTHSWSKRSVNGTCMFMFDTYSWRKRSANGTCVFIFGTHSWRKESVNCIHVWYTCKYMCTLFMYWVYYMCMILWIS